MEIIPYLSLQKINEPFIKQIQIDVNEIIKSGRYILGDNIKSFEKELANYCGTSSAVGVGNCLDAIRIILMAYMEQGKLNVGDEVLVPSNTFIATMLSVSSLGLKPIFVEPKLKSFLLDDTCLEKYIGKKTKALILVHLYGRVSFSKKIQEIGKDHNLILIEDNAQALGAQWNGNKTGSLGNACAISFYPAKNLGAFGDAGGIVTNDQNLFKLCKQISNYGSSQKYVHSIKGLNSRMDEIQAAILRIKLKYLDSINNKRRRIAEFYIKNISNSKLILPQIPKDPTEHVWHIFAIRTKNRDKLQNHLLLKGIQTIIHYPTPPHKQGAYKEFSQHSYPISESIHNEVLSIPLNETLTDNQQTIICEALNSY